MSKYARIIKNLFNVLYKIICYLICAFFIFCLIGIILVFFSDYPDFKIFTHPKDYKEALKHSCYKEINEYFPKEIPNNAKDIQLYKPNDCWFGSEYFFLAFVADKEYINNELKKINAKK